MIYRVLHLGEEPLRKTSEPITEINDELRTLVEDMFASMYEANGCGLAAPQIGKNIRLAVIDLGNDPLVMINPEVIKASGKETAEEGCLSLPGLQATAVDIDGTEYEVEAEGLLARAIQHELDHLDGVLFIDRISKARRLQLKHEFELIEKGEKLQRTSSGTYEVVD